MIDIIRPGQRIIKSIFLAGPSRRDGILTPWREEAIQIMKDNGYNGYVFSPEPFVNNYTYQIDWENFHLTCASRIVFWIPRDLDTLPGFTTNIEWGEWMKSGKVILGYPIGTPKIDYIQYKAECYNVPVYHDLKSTIIRAISD
jgi:hypothetical protein